MIDIQLLRKDITHVAERLAQRKFKLDVAAFNALEAERKAIQTRTEELQSQRNSLSKQIGILKGKGEDTAAVMNQVAGLGDELKASADQLELVQAKLSDFMLAIPNLPHESVPQGDDEQGNVELRKVGTPRAFEDAGLADPRALRLTLDAAETYERLGSPEGELALAEATIYLACAAKSNAVYNAYNAVKAFVSKDSSRPVPEHLRNAPTKLMKQLGYGKLYRYAHDEPEAYAAGETYLPEGLGEPGWYQPTSRGLEGKIAEKLAYLKRLDAEANSNVKKK